MNWSEEEVALVPPVVTTVILTVPADSAGEVAVIDVAEFTVTAVAATEPNITVASVAKPVPVMVTVVAPVVGPEVGEMAVTLGAVEGAT